MASKVASPSCWSSSRSSSTPSRAPARSTATWSTTPGSSAPAAGRCTRDVVLPSRLTWILASLHVGFGFALIGAIVGEYTGADKGLGLLITHSQGTFDPAGIYAAMIIITVLALAAEGLLTLLERRLLRWRPAATTGCRPLTPPPAARRRTHPTRSHQPSKESHPMKHLRARLAAAAAVAALATGWPPARPTARPAPTSGGAAAGDAQGHDHGRRHGQGDLPAGHAHRAARLLQGRGRRREPADEPAGADAPRTCCRRPGRRASVGFYDHTIALQTQGKCVESVVQLRQGPRARSSVVAATEGTDHVPGRLHGQAARRHQPRLVDRLPHPVPRDQERRRPRDYTTVTARRRRRRSSPP